MTHLEPGTANRSWKIYGLLAFVAVMLLAMPGGLVVKRLSEAVRLERIATAGGCMVQWGWRQHDQWYDSPTMRRIFGNAMIGFHRDRGSGTPGTNEQWLAVSAQLRPVAHRIHGVDFSQSAVGTDSLRDLAAYPGLVTLCLSNTRLSDDGLDVLSELPRIEFLMLSESGVTDAALNDLSVLPELKALHVDASQLTAAGVSALSALTSLQELYVRDLPQADPSVHELAKQNPQLKIVSR